MSAESVGSTMIGTDTNGLVILNCGLPASGKTWFVQNGLVPGFAERACLDKVRIRVNVVDYDKLLWKMIAYNLSRQNRPEFATTGQPVPESEMLSVRQYRDVVYNAVSNLVSKKQDPYRIPVYSEDRENPQTMNRRGSNVPADLVQELRGLCREEIQQQSKTFGPEGERDSDSSSSGDTCSASGVSSFDWNVYIIDDNMCYRSMRRVWYSFARINGFRYGLLLYPMDPVECKRRNAQRSLEQQHDDDYAHVSEDIRTSVNEVTAVTNETIDRMARQFQDPLTSSDGCDTGCIVVHQSVLLDQQPSECIKVALAMIDDLEARPVPEKPITMEERDALRNQSRAITESNKYQYLDLQIRRMVNTMMKPVADDPSINSEKTAALALNLTNLKKETLADITKTDTQSLVDRFRFSAQEFVDQMLASGRGSPTKD
eukprot:Clim_evm7s17 gene=Clim_evmTU7s17